MKLAMNRTWIAVGIQFGAVGIGYVFGQSYPARPLNGNGCLAIIGMVLLAIGLFTQDGRSPPRFTKFVGSTVLAYMAIVVLVEPFLEVWSNTELILACLWLTPLLLALGALARLARGFRPLAWLCF